MKKTRFMIAVLVVIATAGCAQSAIQTSTTKQAATEPITIGFIGPLSGDQAVIGTDNLRGIEIAVDEVNKRGGINGQQIKLLFQDDQFNEKETINAYTKLTQTDRVNYILTATYGGYLSLPEQASRDDVLVIETLDTSEELAGIGKNMFAVGIYDESIGFAIADYLNAQGITKAGAIILQDPFTALVTDALQKRFRGTIAAEHYVPGTQDYRTALTKLSSQEAFILIGWEETGRAVKQARELGIDIPIIGIDTVASEGFRENTGKQYNGILFTFWEGSEENEIYFDLVESYKERYRRDPENVLFLATGYDAAMVLFESMQGCSEKIGCIRENLRNVRGFRGATGVINIDEDQITRSIRERVYRYDGDKIVPAKESAR